LEPEAGPFPLPLSPPYLTTLHRLGFVVNTFTWAQAVECLSHPEWSFVHVVTIALVAFTLVGLALAVRRDRQELHLVEALMAAQHRQSGRLCEAMAGHHGLL